MEAEATGRYSHFNHHHEITEDQEFVNFGTGEFIADKPLIPLLKALNESGLKTRTHNYSEGDKSFISILMSEGVFFEIRKVHEVHSTRSQFNGETELLICWETPKESEIDLTRIGTRNLKSILNYLKEKNLIEIPKGKSINRNHEELKEVVTRPMLEMVRDTPIELIRNFAGKGLGELKSALGDPNYVNIYTPKKTYRESKKQIDMSGPEILKRWMKLPITERFTIAENLGVIEKGESVDSPRRDFLSSQFLNRAKDQNKLEELKSMLKEEQE